MSKIQNFDLDRQGTGTAEWAEFNANICEGCSNNCLYCYAAQMAIRFKRRKRADWALEKLTKQAEITKYPLRDGVVMFPSSHDITPFTLEAFIKVAKLILTKGNRLLIVSKPRRGCIERLIAELALWNEQMEGQHQGCRRESWDDRVVRSALQTADGRK